MIHTTQNDRNEFLGVDVRGAMIYLHGYLVYAEISEASAQSPVKVRGVRTQIKSSKMNRQLSG